jgi:uncharacterized protein
MINTFTLIQRNQRICIEIKASTSPKITKGFWNSLNDLNIKKSFIITPVKDIYSIKKNIYISGLKEFFDNI